MEVIKILLLVFYTYNNLQRSVRAVVYTFYLTLNQYVNNSYVTAHASGAQCHCYLIVTSHRSRIVVSMHLLVSSVLRYSCPFLQNEATQNGSFWKFKLLSVEISKLLRPRRRLQAVSPLPEFVLDKKIMPTAQYTGSP